MRDYERLTRERDSWIDLASELEQAEQMNVKRHNEYVAVLEQVKSVLSTLSRSPSLGTRTRNKAKAAHKVVCEVLQQ